MARIPRRPLSNDKLAEVFIDWEVLGYVKTEAKHGLGRNVLGHWLKHYMNDPNVQEYMTGVRAEREGLKSEMRKSAHIRGKLLQRIEQLSETCTDIPDLTSAYKVLQDVYAHAQTTKYLEANDGPDKSNPRGAKQDGAAQAAQGGTQRESAQPSNGSGTIS